MSEAKINHFARHRTVLANDRTFLAYIRTSLTLFVAGVSFIRFFNITLLSYLGFAFIVVSVVMLVLGIYRFRKTNLHIKNVK